MDRKVRESMTLSYRRDYRRKVSYCYLLVAPTEVRRALTEEVLPPECEGVPARVHGRTRRIRVCRAPACHQAQWG